MPSLNKWMGMGNLTADQSDITDRFLSGVPIVGKDLDFYNSKVIRRDGCWGWIGSKLPKGYGTLMSHHEHKVFSAHRFSWTVHFGTIPTGLHVLHKCDNPECSNPEHLFLGTSKDNIRDAITKGRRYTGVKPRGERHWKSKLDASQVIEIRRKYELGMSLASLGLDYSVYPTAIHKIVTRKLWRHLQ